MPALYRSTVLMHSSTASPRSAAHRYKVEHGGNVIGNMLSLALVRRMATFMGPNERCECSMVYDGREVAVIFREAARSGIRARYAFATGHMKALTEGHACNAINVGPFLLVQWLYAGDSSYVSMLRHVRLLSSILKYSPALRWKETERDIVVALAKSKLRGRPWRSRMPKPASPLPR
jgi:hypothetical protein